MSNIKLRNNVTGEIIEKTELNWKHLPNDRKAQYTVVDGEGTAAAPVKNFSPPELDKKETPKEEVKEVTPAAPADETQDQAIVRLYNAAAPKDEDEKKAVIKSIAKEVAAHFKTVEKIVNASLKK